MGETSLSILDQSKALDVKKKHPMKRFEVLRIKLEPLYLDEDQRSFLINQLNDGKKFVHIGEETIASSSIVSISPMYSQQEAEEKMKKLSQYQDMKNLHQKANK